MTHYQAIGIAEGFEPADSELKVLEAWSHIGKNGLHLTLQGWFGRTLYSLVEQGLLTDDFDINEEALEEL